MINTVDTPDTILKRSVPAVGRSGSPHRALSCYRQPTPSATAIAGAPTNPAAENIDVLLAQVRPPISGERVRMVMCPLNVKPRRARRRIPTPVNRRIIHARSTRYCTEGHENETA